MIALRSESIRFRDADRRLFRDKDPAEGTVGREQNVHLRIQGTGCELFLLHTRLTPEQFRIEMSRTLAAIRAARADRAAARSSSEARPRSPSPVEELAKLADMLKKAC